MKQQLTRSKLTFFASFLVLVICTGCPYEGQFPLSGTAIKYDKNLVGEWNNGETDMDISRIDDYTFRFVYDDHDPDFGGGRITGKGYAVSNNGDVYIVGEKASGTKKYFTYKVISSQPNAVKVIPLDEDFIGEKTFSSAASFTGFVIENSGAFSTRDIETYKREGVQKTTASRLEGIVLFSDYFTSNINKWPTNTQFRDSHYVYVASGDQLYFSNHQTNSTIVDIPYTLPSRYDYSIAIYAKHIEDKYKNTSHPFGIKFAAQDWNNTYDLHITETGYFRVSKKQNGVYSVMVPWTKSSALKTGYQYNKMEVKVFTSHFEVYLNDQFIHKVTGFVPFGANAGLQVFNKQTIYYDNLVIRKI